MSESNGNWSREGHSPPGRPGFAPAALVISLAVAAGIAYSLAWVYGPLDYYSPLIYLNILIAYGMGTAMGVVGARLMRIMKINSALAGTLIGAAAGIASAWFGWTTYLWTITDHNWDFYWKALGDPAALWGVIAYLARHPVWTIKGTSGDWPVFYWAVWVGEFLTLVWLPIRRCRDFANNNLLCRRCSAWIRETGDAAVFADADPEDQPVFRAALANGDASILAGLARRAPGDPAGEAPDLWLEAKGFACPNCEDEDSYVRIARMSLHWDSKNKRLELRQHPLSGFIQVDVETEERVFAAPPAGTEGGPEPPGGNGPA